MYDIIAIGDTTTDVFLEIDDASVECTTDKENCRLSLRYGSKVPVKNIIKINGVGNAANHAIGAAKLGLKVALTTQIGNDDAGKDIYQKMKRHRVKTEYIRFDRDTSTNYSTVLDFRGDRTILSYHEARTYELPRLAKARWVYFSSLARGTHERFHEQLFAYLDREKVKLAFNPGSHQLKLGRDGLAPILTRTSILFLNKEEAEQFIPRTKNIAKLLTGIRALGPEVAVITDGQNGSYAFDGGIMWELPIFEAPAIERTGCGDAYASGFLAAIVCKQTIPEAMRWGSVNAAGVIQRIGPQAGLLTRAEIQKMLEQHPEFETRAML